MGLRDWVNRMFGGSGEEAFDRAEEEHDFEPRVDIDAIKADVESARVAGETTSAAADRMSDPDAP
jgi:hypothetical protein